MPGETSESGLMVQRPLADDNVSLEANTPIAGTPNFSARIVAGTIARGTVLYGELPTERARNIGLILERHGRAQQEVQSLSSEIRSNCLQSLMLVSAAIVLGTNNPLNWPAIYTLSVVGLIGAYKLYKAGIGAWEIPDKKQNAQRLGRQLQDEVSNEQESQREEQGGGGGTPDEVLEEGRIVHMHRVASNNNLSALGDVSNTGSRRDR